MSTAKAKRGSKYNHYEACFEQYISDVPQK